LIKIGFKKFYNPKIHSFVLGTCYKFNSGFDEKGNKVPLKYINKEGGGLSVQMFAGLSDVVYDYLYEPSYRGVLIVVDDPNNVLLKNDGSLNSGIFSNIWIQKTITDLMPAPYGVCVFNNQIDTPLSREMKRLGFTYSRKNCITFCEQHQTINMLGCYDMRLPRIYNATPCNTEEQFYKLINIVFNYTSCYDFCPFECSTTSFSLSTSYANYPSYTFYVSETLSKQDYYETLFDVDNINDVTYPLFSDAIGGVFIGFQQLQYTHYADSPSYEIMDIFANVGGTLGLFLGFSILSFVELLDLLYNVIRVTINIYRTRSRLRKELTVSNINVDESRI
jgi:acid-sensing ion channel 2